MTDDLFPGCRSESPRLAWMRRYGITVRPVTVRELMHLAVTDGIDDDAGGYQYIATAPTLPDGSVSCYGPTEDDALAGVAKALGIPLWNEEAYTAGRSGK